MSDHDASEKYIAGTIFAPR